MLHNATMTFPSLDALEGFGHGFILRHPLIDVMMDRDDAITTLQNWHTEIVCELGFDRSYQHTAEQVHGGHVAVIEADGQSFKTKACDGLLTNVPGVALCIYVADCCAVYIVDPWNRACGIVHSGKRGTELNITGKAIAMLAQRFGSDPKHLIVQLSPCIRPPAYEIDFAADVRRQAIAAGVLPENLHDSGICTSSDLSRFYSYRVEKGKTGRMLAVIGRRG